MSQKRPPLSRFRRKTGTVCYHKFKAWKRSSPLASDNSSSADLRPSFLSLSILACRSSALATASAPISTITSPGERRLSAAVRRARLRWRVRQELPTLTASTRAKSIGSSTVLETRLVRTSQLGCALQIIQRKRSCFGHGRRGRLVGKLHSSGPAGTSFIRVVCRTCDFGRCD